MLPRRPQSALYRYSLAAISVCAATAATRALRGVGDSGISPLFFAAVLLSAWYGGLGPGLLATLLSSIAAAYLLLKGAAVRHSPPFPSIFYGSLSSAWFPSSPVPFTGALLQGAAAEASRKAKEAAEAASEAKSRFIAMVSHELRTPLNPVLMMTQMMENDPSLTVGMQKRHSHHPPQCWILNSGLSTTWWT